MMTESAIDRAVQRGQGRNEENQPTLRFEQLADRGERRDVVLHVLQHIEADDRIEALAADGAVVVRQIEMRHRDVRVIRESRAEPGQVFLPRIRQYEALAVDEERREVADPRADLQHLRSDPGTDPIEHPGVVAHRAGETLQCLRANGISRLDFYLAPLPAMSPRSDSASDTASTDRSRAPRRRGSCSRLHSEAPT